MGSSDLTRGLWADDPALLFGLAPGGVCHAFAITGEPVSSYLAISTLPAAEAAGGVFSVVLSPDRSEPSLTATFSLESGLSSPRAEHEARSLDPL